MISLYSMITAFISDFNLIVILISIGVFAVNFLFVFVLARLKILFDKIFKNHFPNSFKSITSHQILKYSFLTFVVLMFPIRSFIMEHDFKPFFPFVVFWIGANFIGALVFSIVLKIKWKLIVWWEKTVFGIWLLIYLPIFSYIIAWLLILPSRGID